MGEESSNYYIDFAQSFLKLFRGTKDKKKGYTKVCGEIKKKKERRKLKIGVSRSRL